jgi:recombination protein RecA
VKNPTKLLQDVADEVNKDFKGRFVLTGNETTHSEVRRWIPTRSELLNLAMGGGVPTGKVLEVYGEPSDGKSTITEEFMCAFQRADGVSILLDAESAWHRERAMAIGHDPDRNIHLDAETVEDGFELIFSTVFKIRDRAERLRTQIRTDKKLKKEDKARLRRQAEEIEAMPVIIVWDTISASPTRAELAGDMFADGIASKPRMVRRALTTLSRFLPNYNTTLVFVNQTYEDLKKGKGQFTSGAKTHGGKSIKFWSAIRLKVWNSGKYVLGEEQVGINSVIKTVKNKLVPPQKQVTVPILFDTGFDPLMESILYLHKHRSDVVYVNGSWYCIEGFGDPLKFYLKNVHDIADANPGLSDYLQDTVRETWYGVS